MSYDLTITSLNLIEEGNKTFLVLEGGGLAVSASDAAINLSFGNEEKYKLDPEAVVSEEPDIRYHFNASNFQNDVFGYGGYGDIIDSKTPGYEHLSDGEFLLKFELKPGIVLPEIYVDWAEISVSTRDYGTVLQQTEKRGLGVLDSGTIGISDVAPELTDLSFREIIVTEGGGTRFEISGTVSQAEGANTNNIVVTYNSGDTWDHEALIESHYIQEDGTFRYYENFWSADDAPPEFRLLGGYVTDSSGNVSFFDETLSKPHDQIHDIWGIYLPDAYNDDAFNITSAYVELGEFINIDIDHDYFEDSVTYTSVHGNWGDSVDWLSISSSGVLSGVVPDEFEHGGFSVEAVINIDGVDTNIWTNFVDFKALNALDQDDSMLDFGGDLWTNSRTNESVLINTSGSDVEFDGNLIGGETIQLSDGSEYSMSELKSITDGNGLSVAGSFGNDYIDLSGLNEDSFSKVIYPFDFANMGVSPGNDTLIAVDFKVDWGLLVSGQELLYAGMLNASNYWENPMADSLLKTGDFDITFNGDGAVTFSDNANGFITDAQNISVVQTVVGAKTQVTGDSSSNIIVSGGGTVDIWAGSGVDSFIITTDIDPMISPQLSMLIHDYEEGEVIRILDTGIATADDFSSTIVSYDDGASYQTEVRFNTGYHTYGSTITLNGAWELNPIDFTSFLSDHGDAALSFNSIYIPKEVNLDNLAKSILGADADFFIGDAVGDYIETGGGDDQIMSGAGDDYVVVHGQGKVVVDVGDGHDTVVVGSDFGGSLRIKGSVTEELYIEQETSYWNVDNKGALTIELLDGSVITVDEYLTYDEAEGMYISNGPIISTFGYDPADLGYGDMGLTSIRGSNYTDDLLYSATYGPYAEFDEEQAYIVNGWDGNDVIYGGAGIQQLMGGSGDDTFHITAEEQHTLIVGDRWLSATEATDGTVLPDVSTENLSYADVVKIGWSYEDSIIEAVGAGYRIENVDLGAVVEVYDVELLKFQNADGSWDDRALTDGAPIAINSKYGNGSGIKFVVSEGDNLQVLAAGRRGDTVLWEGNRLEVDGFNFSDGVSINVINISDADVFDNPIVYTMGTEGVDLIFGNDSDNLIDGKGGDDIIFGGGGNDVIIGGEGNDVITGGAGDDIIRGDGVDVDDAAAAYFEDAGVSGDSLSASDMITDGNDTIIGGDGVDDIESGNGENFVASGRVDLDGDGAADLDLIKEHMTTNQNVFDDDEWI